MAARVADALDAWIETHTPTWAASTVRDQTSRASLVKADKIARTPLGRLDGGRCRSLARAPASERRG